MRSLKIICRIKPRGAIYWWWFEDVSEMRVLAMWGHSMNYVADKFGCCVTLGLDETLEVTIMMMLMKLYVEHIIWLISMRSGFWWLSGSSLIYSRELPSATTCGAEGGRVVVGPVSMPSVTPWYLIRGLIIPDNYTYMLVYWTRLN